MLIWYRYKKARPDDSLIQQQIIGNRPYIYITATKALSRERRSLIPDSQYREENGKQKRHVVFADFIRMWLKDHRYSIASRLEEKTVLSRAMERAASGNEKLVDLFRKDARSWTRVLTRLAAEGVDTSRHPLPDHLQKLLVNPVIEAHLNKIQQEFYIELKRLNLRFFDEAARHFLLTSCNSWPLVIMEGFTYFTELQKLFIEACIKQDIDICFITPYSCEQVYGFDIIDRTYRSLPGVQIQDLDTDPASQQDDLNFVQEKLFANRFTTRTFASLSVRLTEYPNRDREMLACIEQLRTWFQNEKYKPNEVVIVMRQSKEFIDRLHDHLAMNPLTYPIVENGTIVQKEVMMFTPQRLLLLTPVGRFILTLYNIWKKNALHMEINNFETILASGWLGARIQDSASLFRAVKYQYFSHCVTKEDWINAFDLFHKQQMEYERLPHGLISRQTLKKWKEALQMLDQVCNRLFTSGTQSIAGHIKILENELMKLIPKKLRSAERQVLEQIRRVFEELSTYYSIEITTEEFGDALHAITRANPEEDEEDEEDTEETNYDPEDTLRIVTPETLDNLTKRAVLYVGADSMHIPALYTEQWPFYEDKRDEHTTRERYMFLTVVRAAEEKLVITYSKKDGNRSFQPSAYLEEIERILSISIDKKTIMDQIDVSLVKDAPVFASPPAARRREYDLQELAHYGLCPLRYRLELLHPEARVYRGEWQLEILAQGIWLHLIYEYLSEQGDTWQSPRHVQSQMEKMNNLFDFLLEAKEETKEDIRALFPTFTPATWHAIEQNVAKQLYYHAKKRYGYSLEIKEGEREEIDVLLKDDTNVTIYFDVPFYMKAGKITMPLLDSNLCYEWLLPGEMEETDNGQETEEETYEILDGVTLFISQYQAVKWWRRTIQSHVLENFWYTENWYTKQLLEHHDRVEEKLQHWIESIEANKFPKHAGEHCVTCPVRMECLGIEGEL